LMPDLQLILTKRSILRRSQPCIEYIRVSETITDVEAHVSRPNSCRAYTGGEHVRRGDCGWLVECATSALVCVFRYAAVCESGWKSYS
jgi:hypothetical protein